MSDRTILNPANANALNNLFNGTGTTTITATTVFLSGNGATDPPNLSSGVSNNVIISSPDGSGLELNTLAGSVVLSAGASGLTVDSAIFLDNNGATDPPNISSGVSNNVIISSPDGSGLELNTTAGSVVLSAGSSGLSINEAILLDNNGATNPPNISSNSTNNLVLSCPNGSGIEINTVLLSISLINNNLGLSLDQPLYLNNSGTTNAPNLSSNSTNNLVLSCPNSAGLTISTPQGNGTLSVNSSSQLTWNGVVIS